MYSIFASSSARLCALLEKKKKKKVHHLLFLQNPPKELCYYLFIFFFLLCCDMVICIFPNAHRNITYISRYKWVKLCWLTKPIILGQSAAYSYYYKKLITIVLTLPVGAVSLIVSSLVRRHTNKLKLYSALQTMCGQLTLQ